MKTVKYVKNILLFALCFAIAFGLTKYGMPLYSFTFSIADFIHNTFGKYQTGIYEFDSDPLTFFSVLTLIIIYALVLFFVVKLLISKFKK